jgi:hypothetical protein
MARKGLIWGEDFTVRLFRYPPFCQGSDSTSVIRD